MKICKKGTKRTQRDNKNTHKKKDKGNKQKKRQNKQKKMLHTENNEKEEGQWRGEEVKKKYSQSEIF